MYVFQFFFFRSFQTNSTCILFLFHFFCSIMNRKLTKYKNKWKKNKKQSELFSYKKIWLLYTIRMIIINLEIKIVYFVRSECGVHVLNLIYKQRKSWKWHQMQVHKRYDTANCEYQKVKKKKEKVTTNSLVSNSKCQWSRYFGECAHCKITANSFKYLSIVLVDTNHDEVHIHTSTSKLLLMANKHSRNAYAAI